MAAAPRTTNILPAIIKAGLSFSAMARRFLLHPLRKVWLLRPGPPTSSQLSSKPGLAFPQWHVVFSSTPSGKYGSLNLVGGVFLPSCASHTWCINSWCWLGWCGRGNSWQLALFPLFLGLSQCRNQSLSLPLVFIVSPRFGSAAAATT